MKPLVIYHANCADGFGAAFAAWLKLGDEAEYLPMQYGKLDMECIDTSIRERDIYILDFSFPRDVMDSLISTAKRIVWLDHHKTAFETWCPNQFPAQCHQSGPTRYIMLDNNKSGAMIAWEYFHPHNEVPMLIKHIDDYDRWQFKLEGTKEFNKALWSYAPWTFERWKDMFTNNPYPVNIGGLYAEGAAILRAHDQNVQSVVKGGARACSIATLVKAEPDTAPMAGCLYPGLAANCPPFLTSDVGHELANQSGTFGLCWTLNKDKPVANCSLRSNGDYDVSAIAKAFGGGGHKNAAGFEVPIETLLGWMK